MGATGNRWTEGAADRGHLVIRCRRIQCAHDRGRVSGAVAHAHGFCKGCNTAFGRQRPTSYSKKCVDLLDFVRPRLSTIDLAAMAYTLQVGREAMEERLGLVVSSVEQLVRKLEAYVAGAQKINRCLPGTGETHERSAGIVQ